MRATASFGLAGVLAAAGFLYFPAMLFGFPLGGLAASLLICRRTSGAGPRVAATIMATVSCGLTGLIVFFSLISMQARIDPYWGALAWGVGFGIGGTLSGPSLSRLWLPTSARSNNVHFAALIAGLAFAFSGAVAGYLGFQGFLALHFYALSLCVCLAYLLGGLLCECGWQRSLARTESKLEEAHKNGSQPKRELAVPASDPERRARNSMVWGIVALSLLVFLVVKVRWPMPWADIILLLVWLVPLMMLGFREVSHQVVFLLVSGERYDGPVGLARRGSGSGPILPAGRRAHTRIAPAQLVRPEHELRQRDAGGRRARAGARIPQSLPIVLEGR